MKRKEKKSGQTQWMVACKERLKPWSGPDAWLFCHSSVTSNSNQRNLTGNTLYKSLGGSNFTITERDSPWKHAPTFLKLSPSHR